MAYKQPGGMNPFRKNFPSSFKQGDPEDAQQEGLSDEELIERSKAQFGEGAEVETISKETMQKAKSLGLLKPVEGGGVTFDESKVRPLLKEAGMGLNPKFYPEEASRVAEINKVVKAFTGGKGYTGSKY